MAFDTERLTPEEAQEMIAIIKATIGARKASIWWITPIPLLADMIPAQMMVIGRARKLYQFVKQQHAENGALDQRLLRKRKRRNL